MAKRFDELPVIAGNDAFVKIDGKKVAWATDITVDQDFELQPVRTLGHHGDRGFKSVGYNANFTVGSFKLLKSAKADEALPQETRTSIITSGLATFEIIDSITGDVFAILSKSKIATDNMTFANNDMAKRTTNWKCTEVKYKDML